MNKFNVLFIASARNVGLSFNFARLAIALKNFGHKVVVVSEPKEEEKGLFAELRRRGMKHYKICGLDNLSMEKTITVAKTMGMIIDDYDIAVVHAQGIRHLLVAFLASKLFSRKRDVGLVVSLHSILAGSSYENAVLLFERLLLDFCADLALPVAGFISQKLVRLGLRTNKILTVHNGIDLDLFDKLMDGNDYLSLLPPDFNYSSSIIVGFFARLAPSKGHKYLMEAISQISKDYPSIKLVVAGDGPLKYDLRKQSRDLGIERNVLFVGWIDHMRLFQLLKMINFYVFPSLGELFPFAVLEAMAAGKPIVATSVGGIPEIIKAGKNGLLVPPGKPESLADGIKRLIGSPTEAEKMGKESRQLVEKRFDLQKIAHDLSRCYQSCIEKKSH